MVHASKDCKLSSTRSSLPTMVLLDSITTGSSVICKGPIVESAGGSQRVEMASLDITLVGNCPTETYPLQKKTPHYRISQGDRPPQTQDKYVWRCNTGKEYPFLCSTPVFPGKWVCVCEHPDHQQQRCRGCRPAVPGHHTSTQNPPPLTEDGNVDFSKDFFGKKSFLTVSGQLEGETYAMAMKNIYTFGAHLQGRKFQHQATPFRILDGGA